MRLFVSGKTKGLQVLTLSPPPVATTATSPVPFLDVLGNNINPIACTRMNLETIAPLFVVGQLEPTAGDINNWKVYCSSHN